MSKHIHKLLTLHDAVRVACADAGIGSLPDLPVIGQVRCPGIGKPPSNLACWISIKIDVAHIVDHSSGFTTSVFAGWTSTKEDRAKLRRKLESAARVREAKQQAAIASAGRAWESAEPCTATMYTE